MKRNFALTVAVVLVMATSCFAGPFSDVPKGHYGYDVLKQAQELGLITTDVSGTMTRYEMATAVAEILSKQDIILAQAKKEVKKKKPVKPAVKPPVKPAAKPEPVKPEPAVKPVDPRKFVTKAELQEALADYATKDDVKKAAEDAKKAVADATKDVAKKADLTDLATKVDANKKSIDEFRASLTRLSKDLREELSALGVRVSDLEKGQAELKDKVSELEKKIPDVGGEIRVRGHYTKIAGGDASFGNYQQRTRLRVSKVVGDNAVATVQFRNVRGQEKMDTAGGDDTTLELANVSADTKLGKLTVGYQYFKLGAYGLLIHDNDKSTGALLWEKGLGKLKLSGIYAVLDATSSKGKSRIIAGRAALPIGAGEIGATMRFKGPDPKLLNDFKDGMAVDLKVGPICAEYATYKEDKKGAESQTMLVAGVKLGRKISLLAVNKDESYKLDYSIASVKQEDLPLILLGSYDKDPLKTDDTIQGVGVNLDLGIVDVEVAKLMEDEKEGASFDGITAKGGLAARITYTTDLAPSVQLQIRGEQIGTKVDATEGGKRTVRGQLLVKF